MLYYNHLITTGSVFFWYHVVNRAEACLEKQDCICKYRELELAALRRYDVESVCFCVYSWDVNGR